MSRAQNRNPLRRRFGRSALIYAVLAVAAIWIVGTLVGRGAEPEQIRFDQFIEKVDDREVSTAEMYLRDQRIEGELDDGTRYQTTFAGDGDTLSERLVTNDVKVTPDPQGTSIFTTFLTSVLPL